MSGTLPVLLLLPITAFCASDEKMPVSLHLGPVEIAVTRTDSLVSKPFPPSLLFHENTVLTLGGERPITLELPDKNPQAAVDYINKIDGLRAKIEHQGLGGELQIRSTKPEVPIQVTQGGEARAAFLLEPKNSAGLQVLVRFQDGSVSHLDQHPVPLDDKQSKLLVVSVGKDIDELCDAQRTSKCYNEYLLFRNSHGELVPGAYMEFLGRSAATGPASPPAAGNGRQNKADSTAAQSPAGSAGRIVLHITPDLARESSDFFAVNGRTWIEPVDPFFVEASQDAWRIERYPKLSGCRAFAKTEARYEFAVIQPPRLRPLQRPSGIVVGDAKVFDVASLTRMLNDTASQLAAISGFNAASIIAAYGNVQGIVRDTSYFNAQVTTAPTPGISQTMSSGATTPNTVSTTMPVGSTTVTLQCPDGSLPTIGSSNTLGGCAAVPVTGTTANVPAYAPVGPASGTFQGQLTTTPAGATTTNTGTTTTTQNGTTTTTPSVSGAVPAALATTAPAAPTNIGYGSADILAEQVQINSQLTTYRLLLQGALSDQYLLRNSRAVAVRQQTTVGFTVSLDPPRQFKHAVAEVRIIVVPPLGQDKVSIMNLLPSEKTYNVAKITSHQNAFGAGAVVEAVSVGVSTGKSKDRLYLAKDTDTIGIQFPSTDLVPDRPLPQRAHDLAKSIQQFQPLGACPVAKIDLQDYDMSNSVRFGWQFRPVLGADYVRGGQRQVFAQLALPAGLEDQYAPKVFVETRWRAYDPKRQVVGAVYSASCVEAPDMSGIVFSNQPRLRDVEMSDLGGGQLKLTGKGDFYSSGLSIRAAAVNLTPAFFDGTKIELIGSAHDLFEAGELTLIGPNGKPHPFGIPVFPAKDDACRLETATATAVPRPDGNSRVEVAVGLGGAYDSKPTADGDLKPLILVGNRIYGLKETPFLQAHCDPRTDTSTTACTYAFLAPTTDLRNAQTFIVKDLAWRHMESKGLVDFAPSFTSLTLLAPSQTDASGGENKDQDATSLEYIVSGFDISKAPPCDDTKAGADKTADSGYCVRIYAGVGKELQSRFVPITDNTATLNATKSELSGSKKLRFVVRRGSGASAKAVTEWDLDVPLPKSAESTPIASPPYLATGDSRKVAFSGPDFSKVDLNHVTFEGALLPATYNAANKSLEVTVSSAVTSKPGHKELTAAMTDPKSKPLLLPIDVVRH